MILLRNPGNHPFSFLPSLVVAHAPPSATYQWVIQPKEEEEDKPEAVAAKLADKSTEQSAAKEGTKTTRSLPLPFSLSALAQGDFEVQHDDEGNFVLTTDLPGVKCGDLHVEFRDGALRVQAERHTRTGVKQRFVRHLPAIDEDAIDIAKLAATLEDGILSVTVPMKKKNEDKPAEDEPRKLTVKTGSPSDAQLGDDGLNLEIDVPGVKVADLQVAYDDKSKLLSVTSERKSRQPRKTSEAYRLNTHKVDASKLEAFLADGVLTIRAPGKAHPMKIVAVNGHVPASKVATKTDAPSDGDGDDSSKEDEVAAKVE